MTHEIPELDSKGLRQFGLMAAGFFAGIFGLILPWLANANYPTWPWVLAAIFIAWALIAPATIDPLYKVWMKVAMFIGAIINKVVLSIAFFGVLLPISIVLRLCGKTPIKDELDANIKSYRVLSTLDKREKMERPF
ncbi:MAG: SxtJ family membrane protein [Gammaproteobacteria bacterium]